MKVNFYKYQGTGNDFIIIDGRTVYPKLSQKEIEKLCNRRFGIGADGLMVIENTPLVFDGAQPIDFYMRYFNADGNEGPMCGNGGRCIVAFAARNGRQRVCFSATDGLHQAEVMERHGEEVQICLGMNSVDQVGFYGDGQYHLNTGAPHLVIFKTGLQTLDVAKQGTFWRNHPDFAPQGTNVNFVAQEEQKTLFVRTYERGVEGETLACGTGVTAAAIAAYLRSADTQVLHANDTHVFSVRTLGGTLHVSFQTDGERFYNIQLTGPATFVFEGSVIV